MVQTAAAPPTVSSRRFWRALQSSSVLDGFTPYLLLGALILLWQIASAEHVVIPFLLPPPISVARWIVDDIWSGRFFVNTAWTLYRAFAGFTLAAAVGIAIGILMSRSKLVHWFFDPVVSVGLPIPKIALLPVFMLWFGLFDTSKIIMVAFSACFQIIASTWQATQSIEKELIWSARSVGATERDILWEVILPAASPQIITGLQITFPVCLIVAVVTEMLMGSQGLGGAMLDAARYVNTAGVFGGIVEIGLVGVCAIKAMEWARRRLISWHQESLRDGDWM